MHQRKLILTKEQKDFIRKNYLSMTGRELADYFDVSIHYIDEFKRSSGLAKPISANHERVIDMGRNGFFNVNARNEGWII